MPTDTDQQAIDLARRTLAILRRKANGVQFAPDLLKTFGVEDMHYHAGRNGGGGLLIIHDAPAAFDHAGFIEACDLSASLADGTVIILPAVDHSADE